MDTTWSDAAAIYPDGIAAVERAKPEFAWLDHKMAALDEFSQLTSQWKNETAFASSIEEIIRHPSYLRIIGMGTNAIAYILVDLQAEAHHWFVALKAITGEDPTNIDDQGNLDAMASAWIEWGRQRGYL